MWSVASESEQAVSNKKDFSQPTLSLNLFWFHWFRRDSLCARNTFLPTYPRAKAWSWPLVTNPISMSLLSLESGRGGAASSKIQMMTGFSGSQSPCWSQQPLSQEPSHQHTKDTHHSGDAEGFRSCVSETGDKYQMFLSYHRGKHLAVMSEPHLRQGWLMVVPSTLGRDSETPPAKSQNQLWRRGQRWAYRGEAPSDVGKGM